MSALKEKLEQKRQTIAEYNKDTERLMKIVEDLPTPGEMLAACLEVLEALEKIATHVDDIESYELARETIAKIEKRFGLEGK